MAELSARISDMGAAASFKKEAVNVTDPVELSAADICRRMFAELAAGKRGVLKEDFFRALSKHGLRSDDVRLSDVARRLACVSDAKEMSYDEFKDVMRGSLGLPERALEGALVIPDFDGFVSHVREIFDRVASDRSGRLPDYIPQLARVNPESFAVSVCTVDGQVFSTEEGAVPYCMQSTCKPVNYCVAMELCGEEKVHSHVGREPSGHGFNEITLNKRGLPHNPMINAGAIMCCSLIYPELPLADRFDHVMNVYARMTGGRRVGFNNSVYLSEKVTADRNYALAYFMREHRAFPPGTDIHAALDFYFQCCSIEVTAELQARMAATLANAGVCPSTGTRVFSSDTVKNCLSLMYSCGMYDFSGEYAFTVGLPAKSGISGALMLVVPNVCGVAIWSPRLDALGNSVRGVEFSKELVRRFNFHNYDSLLSSRGGKIDPRRAKGHGKAELTCKLIGAAASGDLHEVRRLTAFGVDVNSANYDGRTALHLAAAEGRTAAAKWLLEHGADPYACDRRGETPAADAARTNISELIALFEVRQAEA